MPDLILYCEASFTSPWVLAVWTALREKGVPFEAQLLDLKKGEHKGTDFAKQTVIGKVPAIRHQELVLAESFAILEYLEEAFPEPGLYPKDRADRARDRQILSWLRSDLFALRRAMPFEGIFSPIAPPAMTPEAREESDKLLAVCAARIASTAGRGPTLADFELASTLRRLIHYRHVPVPEAIARWSDAIWARPSIQSWNAARARTANIA
jgi:glutathione S-transferase